MSINLNDVNSGYNISAINDNFQKVEDYVNNNLLHRAGNVSGEAKMSRDLDMDGHRILNTDIDGSSITNDRAIRVSDMFLPAIPQTNEQRKGNIVTFDINTGAPIAVAPASGSAVDVLNQLALPTGYTLIPSIPIQKWIDEGDIRGWGAVCDGVTDDSTAIALAIAAKSGKIVIAKSTFVSTHILFNNLSDVNFTIKNGATINIGTGFIFNASYRGIVVYNNCNNVTTKEIRIKGAKVDKTNAAEPWQDGDAGIEYINCTGNLVIDGIKVKDVKTWGVIHVTCPTANSSITNGYFENCQVQSGIGGTGYKSLNISNCYFYDIGLYGVELETRARNIRTEVANCVAELCNKGFAAVHNSDNILISSSHALNCKTGFSLLSENSADPSYLGNGQSVLNNVATSCKTPFEFVYPTDLTVMNNVENRDAIDYFVRTRALDRVIRVDGSVAKFALDSVSENPGLNVNDVIQMDDGTQFTITSVDASPTSDPVFGNLIGFTTSPAMTSAYARSSFRRYVQISTGKTSVVLYGGSNVVIKNNHFTWSETVLASYGDHNYLDWSDNTTYSCSTYFAVGSAGTVSNSRIDIQPKSNKNFGAFGSLPKFAGAFTANRHYAFRGGNSNAETKIQHAIPIEEGFIGNLSVAINAGQTTTGTIVLKINGTDLVVGGFTGTPLRANVTLNSPLNVGDAAIVQLTDTFGDLVASGYSVHLRGVFK